MMRQPDIPVASPANIIVPGTDLYIMHLASNAQKSTLVHSKKPIPFSDSGSGPLGKMPVAKRSQFHAENKGSPHSTNPIIGRSQLHTAVVAAALLPLSIAPVILADAGE
jgi:hypothetical protein